MADLIEWTPHENSDDKDQHRRATRVFLWDFDNVSYSVRVDEKDTDTMYVSMNLPFLDEVMEHGAGKVLETTYAGLVSDEGEDNYNITLKIPFDDYTDPSDQKTLIENLEKIKPNVVGGVFLHYFEGVANGTKTKPFSFDMRPDTQVYFAPGSGRCVVTFGLAFSEKVDGVIAKIFMQEFADARRNLGAAPPVMFTVDPPRELHQFGIKEKTGNLGFAVFTILPGHVSSPQKRQQVAEVLQGFRTYIQYHIKCSKSYFHSRMRKRVVELLKVLNRAKVKAVVSAASKDPTKGANKAKNRTTRFRKGI